MSRDGSCPWKFRDFLCESTETAMRFFSPLSQKGLTLLELLIALVIMSILASAVLPLSEVTVRRSKEIELQNALRIIRTAIDEYKKSFDQAVQDSKIIKSVKDTGYPKRLEDLVTGSDFGGTYPYNKRFLRRIPKDPFDRDEQGWGLRSYVDDPDTLTWGGEDVYDVFSQGEGVALDGTYYRDW